MQESPNAHAVCVCVCVCQEESLRSRMCLLPMYAKDVRCAVAVGGKGASSGSKDMLEVCAKVDVEFVAWGDVCEDERCPCLRVGVPCQRKRSETVVFGRSRGHA